ncbi:hypothetical protein [Cohnella sp. REN36]|nr:hypothetical protein [Cohnella sp. REN36]MCC3375568.1 hypothetical protein [Cohnella sp. REN36]
MLVPDWIPAGYWVVSLLVMTCILIWAQKRGAEDRARETKKDEELRE